MIYIHDIIKKTNWICRVLGQKMEIYSWFSISIHQNMALDFLSDLYWHITVRIRESVTSKFCGFELYKYLPIEVFFALQPSINCIFVRSLPTKVTRRHRMYDVGQRGMHKVGGFRHRH